MRLPHWLRIALVCVLLVACPSVGQAAFTEFYCNASTGSNTYAGSTESATPVLTLTGGDWVSSTGVFTKTGQVTGVTTGMFAAVMVDGGTVAARIGRVTAVDANTITISTTAGSGSLANQTGTCTLTVGGCWKGPNGTEDFPLDFITAALTNASNDCACINLKSGTEYDITAAIAPNQNGPMVVSGYSSTVRDGGRAVIRGPATGSAISLLTSGASCDAWRFQDLEFTRNGDTSTNIAVDFNNSPAIQVWRCKVYAVLGQGIRIGTGSVVSESEVTGWNQSATAGTDGIGLGSGTPAALVIRCYVHDESGTNGDGIDAVNGMLVSVDDVVKDVGRFAYYNGNSGRHFAINSDSYSCQDGHRMLTGGVYASLHYAENCNHVANSGYGFYTPDQSTRTLAMILAPGKPTGSAANGTAFDNAGSRTTIVGDVTYPANLTPWRDPANGDFTIVLPQAKGAGRGQFPGGLFQGYPDIGAAQHLPSSQPLIGGGIVR